MPVVFTPYLKEKLPAVGRADGTPDERSGGESAGVDDQPDRPVSTRKLVTAVAGAVGVAALYRWWRRR